MENLNFLAILTCAILNLVLGGLWYSPLLFQKSWLSEINIKANDYIVNPIKTYSFAFIFALIISFGMASFLAGGKSNWQEGMFAGFMSGLTLASMIFSIIALFELRSWKYILIHCLFITTYFTLIGAILGGWR
ncbi:DUF1761 domain-containing protein [Hyunsoonleella aestuarii]|uniref:DUF1761 domain-containing protein n=1 Tax=Hyunsoonleella aestuarii TaxID=912802 RepID=A0ABP8E7N7_9FLAO|nr:DUF1761 domain-containing protein [Hyunsoonleella aestuarii]